MMLTFYDARMGAAVDVRLETSSQHEMLVFKDCAKKDGSPLKERGSLWRIAPSSICHFGTGKKPVTGKQ